MSSDMSNQEAVDFQTCGNVIRPKDAVIIVRLSRFCTNPVQVRHTQPMYCTQCSMSMTLKLVPVLFQVVRVNLEEVANIRMFVLLHLHMSASLSA